MSSLFVFELTLNLLTTTIVAPPSNASKWQMGFNSAFKGLKKSVLKLLGRTVYIGPCCQTGLVKARTLSLVCARDSRETCMRQGSSYRR